MATKRYSHAVIVNGQFYPPNSPIEVEEKTAKKGVKKDDTRTNTKS